MASLMTSANGTREDLELLPQQGQAMEEQMSILNVATSIGDKLT